MNKTLRKPRRDPSADWALLLAGVADQKKGIEIAVHDVSSLVDYADYFIFVTAANRRHVQAIAEALESVAKDRNLKIRLEGYASGWWVVLDIAGVVVHVFQPEARSFYDLDHLWADAPSIPVRKRKTAAQAEASPRTTA